MATAPVAQSVSVERAATSKVTVNLPSDLVEFVKERADGRGVSFTQELRDLLVVQRYLLQEVVDQKGELLAKLPGRDVRQIVLPQAL